MLLRGSVIQPLVCIPTQSEGTRANIWFAENSLHTFLMLAGELPASVFMKDFSHCGDYNAWVCDPWSNLFCEMSQFPMMVMAKAQQWEAEGKEIYTGFNDTALQATHWAHRLLRTKMYLDRMTDNRGRQTDFYKKCFTLSWSTKLSRWWRSR